MRALDTYEIFPEARLVPTLGPGAFSILTGDRHHPVIWKSRNSYLRTALDAYVILHLFYSGLGLIYF